MENEKAGRKDAGTLKVRVRKGYVYAGRDGIAHPAGTVLELPAAEVARNKWRFELVKAPVTAATNQEDKMTQKTKDRQMKGAASGAVEK